MNGAGKDWTANILAININPVFIRWGTASSITLKWTEVNLEERSAAEEEKEKEKEGDLVLVRRPKNAPVETSIHWKRNSVLVQKVNEVFTATVNERNYNVKEDHLGNSNNDSVQLRQELEWRTFKRLKKDLRLRNDFYGYETWSNDRYWIWRYTIPYSPKHKRFGQ